MLESDPRTPHSDDINPTMKILLSLGLAAGALTLLPALVPTSTNTNDEQPSATLQDEEEGGPLHEAMETLGGGMRKLRKLLKDPKSKELLPLLEEMEAAAMIAMANPPEAPEDLEGAALALWKISYRQENLGLAQDILTMQEAAVNQDGDALKTASRALVARKKSGHGKFQ
jgi:hypothetical protein